MSDEYKPFEALKKAKLKLKPTPTQELFARAEAARLKAEAEKRAGARAAGPKPGRTAAARADAPAPAAEDDLAVFERAMSGVAPLAAPAKGTRGREVPARDPEDAPGAAPAGEIDPDAETRARLLDLVEGKVEFDLEYTDEYIHGHVRDLDAKIFRQLKTGQLSIEGHLDLHGCNAEQAYLALLQFLKSGYLQGQRCLLVIPGRGRNSPGGQSVLKDGLQAWLTRDPLRRVILAFATALPKHGGAGALYVLLRKSKKAQGKVFWERHFPDL
jgi:DNA-nicking Smr family endonuclease